MLPELNDAKHLSRSSTFGVDYCRALCFLKPSGDPLQARQAVLEELRNHPHNQEARELLHAINHRVRRHLLPPPEIRRSEPLFYLLCDALLDHTMLTWPRLLSLFRRAQAIGASPQSRGHVVECGTAGGGSAVLTAVAMALAEPTDAPSTRRVFVLDTFTGMPIPGTKDRLISSEDSPSVSATETAWGAGTCSAPPTHVQQLASYFGVHDRLVVVPGLFQETLPTLINAQLKEEGVIMLHLDADWYDSTRCALEHILPVMCGPLPGGHSLRCVQVDDYGYWDGCRRAVDDTLRTWAAAEGVEVPSLQPIDDGAVLFNVP